MMALMSKRIKLITAAIFATAMLFFLFMTMNSGLHRQLPPNVGQEGLLKYFTLISIEANSDKLDQDLRARSIDAGEFYTFVVDTCEQELHQISDLKNISIKRNHEAAFKESAFNLGITFYFEYSKSPQAYYRISRTSIANTYQYFRTINHPYQSLLTMDRDEALKIYTGEISRKLQIPAASEKSEFLGGLGKVIKLYCRDLAIDMKPEVNETKKAEIELLNNK